MHTVLFLGSTVRYMARSLGMRLGVGWSGNENGFADLVEQTPVLSSLLCSV